jgi:hypothetical protein
MQWMHLKDQYSELARAAGSPGDAWFGDPLESHEQVLERIKALAEKAWRYDELQQNRKETMAEEKMSLIDELQNPPRTDDGHLDEDRVVDLMRVAADALSTMIGVAASLSNGIREGK